MGYYIGDTAILEVNSHRLLALCSLCPSLNSAAQLPGPDMHARLDGLRCSMLTGPRSASPGGPLLCCSSHRPSSVGPSTGSSALTSPVGTNACPPPPQDIPGGHPYMLSLGILGGIYAFENPLQGCLLVSCRALPRHCRKPSLPSR